MAEFKCTSCDMPMRVRDLKHDRDWCLRCWKEHLDKIVYDTKMKLKIVEERMNKLQD